MQIAPGFISKTLEELPGEAKAEGTGHILAPVAFADGALRELVQATPNQVRTPAEINNAPGKAFVHGYVSFTGERIPGVKPRPVTADSSFISQRLNERLSQRDAAIFHGMVRVHFQIPRTFQLQIHYRVLREERKHVVEERDARLDF